MNNRNMIIAAIVVFGLILGGIFVMNVNNSQTPTLALPMNQSTPQNDSSVGIKNDDNSVSESRYVFYSKENLENTSETRRVLFFYANWCPLCRPADSEFNTNTSKIPEDVTLIRVNYNDSETDQEERDLATLYGVTYQHTFVQIDSKGKDITKWNGGKLDELLINIK